MYLPAAVTKQSEIQAAIHDVERCLAPDVVRIRYEIGEDWSGQWAIFFRVLLSDEVNAKRLRDITAQVMWRMSERLNLPELGPSALGRNNPPLLSRSDPGQSSATESNDVDRSLVGDAR